MLITVDMITKEVKEILQNPPKKIIKRPTPKHYCVICKNGIEGDIVMAAEWCRHDEKTYLPVHRYCADLFAETFDGMYK